MATKKLVLLATKFVTSTIVARPAPTVFYYTGLSAQQFHNTSLFPFTEKLQSNLQIVQNEYKELRQIYKVNNFVPEEKEHVLSEGTMQWMTFWDHGKPNDAVRKLCPKTTKLLETIPDLITTAPFGRTYFSCLGPNSSVKPHTGPTNVKLRCHLPIFVPGEGFIRVGGKFTQWEEGKLIIFDESFVHEEANVDNEKERAVLVFDIWHPDLTTEERELLTTGYKNFIAQHSESAKPK